MRPMPKPTLSELIRRETDEARSLLRARRGVESRASIAEKCGLNPHWLEKFDQEAIDSPRDFGRIEALLKYLRASQREAA